MPPFNRYYTLPFFKENVFYEYLAHIFIPYFWNLGVLALSTTRKILEKILLFLLLVFSAVAYTSLSYENSYDFLGVSLILSSFFSINLCVLLNKTTLIYFKSYLLSFHNFLLLLVGLILTLAFSVSNVFSLPVCFEAILVPLVLSIGFFGSRAGAKIQAIYKLYFFTFIGSLPWLFSLVYISNKFGTLNYFSLNECVVFEISEEIWFFLAFFLAFAVKLPIVPLHLWLAEAHVEASTSGSVSSAGIISKLSLYAFIRFLLPFFPLANMLFSPFIISWAFFSTFFAVVQGCCQVDFKRIIAYSSVAHMSFFPGGLYTMTNLGTLGTVLGIFSHAFIASGLFMLAGFLYDRFKTRNLFYFSGISGLMPIFSAFAVFFSLANLPFPGFSSFVPEVLIFTGLPTESFFLFVLFNFVTFFVSLYSLRFLLVIFFGKINIKNFRYVSELNSLEFVSLGVLLFPTIFLGYFPRTP